MANDPNRDLLPVKEENCCRFSKGLNEKIDHQNLVKLSRCELEDRFLRLLDEQIHLKKLLNCQEEKIKRLGTKLLRLISEKRSGRKNSCNSKETEELHLKIIELEHENYTLKDKNTVLKQQLANHSRHIVAHPSPLRSTHTSPLMSVRQSTTNQNEVVYEPGTKISSTETQLRDAELHIKELNKEIRSLHTKIDYLQQDMERNSLDSRKTKVTENIELIRLQRSVKQQSIQIATLQAQVKNSETNQKILKEELAKAHNENDEAVNLISVKQNEILSLYSKLEENNLNRLEDDELRERINDLVKERDALQERSEFLMKTIEVKSDETEKLDTFKRLLAEEKSKKENLEVALRETKALLKQIQDEKMGSVETCRCSCQNSGHVSVRQLETSAPLKDIKIKSATKEMNLQERIDEPETAEEFQRIFDGGAKTIDSSSDHEEDPLSVQEAMEKSEKKNSEAVGMFSTKMLEEKFNAEKMKLKREMEYLRDMLRSQTARCEAQQTQINRLMYELKLNEEKCDFILQRERFTLPTDNSRDQNSAAIEKDALSATEGDNSKNIQEKDIMRSTGSAATLSDLVHSESFRMNSGLPVEKTLTKKGSDYVMKKRFIDQVFLESSEEEELSDGKPEKATFMKKLETLGNEMTSVDKSGNSSASRDRTDETKDRGLSPSEKAAVNRRKLSADSWTYSNDSNLQTREKNNDISAASNRSENLKLKVRENQDIIQIAIMWLRINTSHPLWLSENIKLLFVDFSFLGIKGEETETPSSLRKPRTSDEKCRFNFYKNIEMTEEKKKTLHSLLNRPEMDLIIFKVVTDPEKSYDDLECEDIGVAVVTVKQFLMNCNKGPIVIPVQNMNNYNEIIANLAISISATPNVLNAKK